MPILLWIVYPFAIWSALLGADLSRTEAGHEPAKFGA